MALKIQIHDISGFHSRNKKKYLKACQLLERVLNSLEFRNEVFNFVYLKDGMAFNGFYQTQKTRQEIYDDIMSGKDNYGSIADEDIDIKVKEYYSPTSTVGYTNSGSLWTYINRKYISKWTPEVVAGNIIHEALHKKGYKHDKKKTPLRQYTVPYGIGSIIRKLISKPILHDFTGAINESPALLKEKEEIKNECKLCVWIKRVLSL